VKRSILCFVLVILTADSQDSYGCSSVCLNKNGQLILGNNMDWVLDYGLVIINKRNVVKRGFWYANEPEWKWTSKYGSISLSTEGREFPIRGINEAGLAIVEMSVAETQYPPTNGLPVLSGSQWIQYQLDNCATVQEVISSQSVVRIEPSDWQGMAPHFLLCDKTGAVAGIEWMGGELIVYSDSTLSIPVMVNSPYASCITTGDDPSGRFKPMADLYNAYDSTVASDAISYLFSILDAGFQNSSFTPTKWQIAFDVHAMRFYWKTALNGQLRYCDLEEFDFSCQTSVEVLDINGDGAGNMRNAFVPYTVDLNSALVASTYSVYNGYSSYLGKTYSQDTINGIIAFPESTFCDVESISKVQNSSGNRRLRLINIPETDLVHIFLPEISSNPVTVSFFDTRGRTIVSEMVSNTIQSGQNRIICKLPSISRGLYCCKINSAKISYVQPFLLKK